MSNFRRINRATPFLLPPSVEDWLAKDHLVRVVVDIVDQLDLSGLIRHRGTVALAFSGFGIEDFVFEVRVGLRTTVLYEGVG